MVRRLLQFLDVFERARNEMIESQLLHRGISDPAVLAAFRSVPREAFVPPGEVSHAHQDRPIPIGAGQTVSQPYIVAFTLESLRLRGRDRVLEIGTGSGYAAALLAEIAAEVYTVERHPSLGWEATERLRALGYDNVHVLIGDGTLGWPEHAPYDAIAVAAAGPRVPEALIEQLAPGGRLVIPVESGRGSQELMRITRSRSGELTTESLLPVVFVPLIGAQGW